MAVSSGTRSSSIQPRTSLDFLTDYMSSPDSSHSPQQQPPPPAAQQDEHAPPPPAEDEPDTLDSSFFPSPSHYFQRYTDDNLALPVDPTAVLTDKAGETFSRAELEPPNPDWVVDKGLYSVFGETWPVQEQEIVLGEMGVQEMFDRNAGQQQPPSHLGRVSPANTFIPSQIGQPPS